MARLQEVNTKSSPFGWTALLILAWSAPAWAENERDLSESVAPESATAETEEPTVLERMISSPLFRPRVSLNLRSYDFGTETDHELTQHTWAAGGKLGLVTPEWRELVSIGAYAYASYPLYVRAPVDRTLLVQPNGDALLVPGESYLNLRRGSFNVRLYRQPLDAAYLNDQDTRMIPNVFEAYALRYSSERIYAAVGHVTRMKRLNSDEYVPMAEAAGVRGGDTDVSAAGIRWRPNARASANALVLNNWDVFSTVYAAGEVGTDLAYQTDLRLSAQYTSQRSVGKEQLGEFDTYTAGLKAALGFRRAVVTVAGTMTGSDAGIRSPFGSKPTYLSLMLFEFDRAAERAWLLGLSYRFDDLGLPSWSFVLNHAQGHGGRDLALGAEDRRRETDLTVDYRPESGKLAGLWLRLRYADATEGDRRLQQWRVILNYMIAFGR